MVGYRLVDRVEGALMGASFGVQLALALAPPAAVNPSPADKAIPPADKAIAPADAAISLEHSLDRHLRLSLQIMMQDQQWHEPHWLPHLTPQTSLAELVTLALPVALFFHEDKRKLRLNLYKLANLYGAAQARDLDRDLAPNSGAIAPQEAPYFEALLLLGYALNQALKQRLSAHSFIPKAIRYLNQGELQPSAAHTAWVQTLEQISFAGVPGAQAPLSLAQSPLMVSLGHMLQGILPRLDQPTLALHCAIETIPSPLPDSHIPLRGLIAGVILGAHNSTLGWPIDWKLPRPQQAGQTLVSDAQVEPIWHLAPGFLAIWAGCPPQRSPSPAPFNPSQPAQALGAIAAPNTWISRS